MPETKSARSGSRAARRAAPAPRTDTATDARVVGGLLRGQPELALLAAAVLGIATLELVDDRLDVVSSVVASRPAALVLPPFDAEHTSTVPLVLRVRREAPGVAVLVLSSHPAGAGQPMLRAVQAGAHVITAPTPVELQKLLGTLLVG